MSERTGRCLCGAVAFKLAAEPRVTRVCWCRNCQHLAANGTVNMLVSTEALSVSGVLSEYTSKTDSGNEMIYQFCPNCGTHLFAKSSGWPKFRLVRVGNLDEPSSIRPDINIWTSSAPSWACFDPALERAEHQPVSSKPSPAVTRT